MENQDPYLTSLETTEVRMPGISAPFTSMAHRPTFRGKWHGSWHHAIWNDYALTSSTITWYYDGKVVVTDGNGMSETWFPRPTLADCVLTQQSGSYTQFRSSGEVVQILNDRIPWYWGAKNKDITPEEISYVRTFAEFNSNDECGCHNNYRCCGWYPSHEDR
jgi:hypothetical protein